MATPTRDAVVRLERESMADGMSVRYIVEVSWPGSVSTATDKAVEAMRQLFIMDGEDA